jgi:hypothetical protein
MEKEECKKTNERTDVPAVDEQKGADSGKKKSAEVDSDDDGPPPLENDTDYDSDTPQRFVKDPFRSKQYTSSIERKHYMAKSSRK